MCLRHLARCLSISKHNFTSASWMHHRHEKKNQWVEGVSRGTIFCSYYWASISMLSVSALQPYSMLTSHLRVDSALFLLNRCTHCFNYENVHVIQLKTLFTKLNLGTVKLTFWHCLSHTGTCPTSIHIHVLVYTINHVFIVV